MLLRNKRLAEITIDDINQLKDSREHESDFLDYKLSWPEVSTQVQKDKFLADVCAFCSTRGGFLIIGVDEVDKFPTEVVGVPKAGTESKIEQLKNIARSGINPRPPEISDRIIPKDENSVIVILEFPMSYYAPHGFEREQFPRFYLRAGGVNVPMNTNSLREAFLGSGSTERELLGILSNRLGAPESHLPENHDVACSVVLAHVLPFSATRRESLDLQLIATDLEQKSYLMDRHMVPGLTWRFDGPSQRAKPRGRLSSSVIFMRSGVVEIVSGNILSYDDEKSRIGTQHVSTICGAIDRAKLLLARAGAAGPALVSLAILQTTRLELIGDYIAPRLCHEDALECEPAFIHGLEVPAHVALRPAFDSIWNAMGVQKCYAFNEDGSLRVPAIP